MPWDQTQSQVKDLLTMHVGVSGIPGWIFLWLDFLLCSYLHSPSLWSDNTDDQKVTSLDRCGVFKNSELELGKWSIDRDHGGKRIQKSSLEDVTHQSALYSWYKCYSAGLSSSYNCSGIVWKWNTEFHLHGLRGPVDFLIASGINLHSSTCQPDEHQLTSSLVWACYFSWS